jgi:hypothetical protein
MSSEKAGRPKRRTAAQRASDVNRENQMSINVRLGKQAARLGGPIKVRIPDEQRPGFRPRER